LKTWWQVEAGCDCVGGIRGVETCVFAGGADFSG